MEEARQYPAVTVFARPNRARLDFDVMVVFPPVSSKRLARQIRQDLWRALQNLRGFSPVIELTEEPDGVCARIGGQVDGQFPRVHCEDVVRDLVANNRARWIRWAAR